MKKYLSCVLIICIISTFAISVCANTINYNEFEKAQVYVFSDNFDDYDSAEFSGSNVNMSESWRTSNNTESDESVSSIKRKFSDGALKIGTMIGDPTKKYTTIRQGGFPAVVLQNDRQGLASDQIIKVTAKKQHNSDMWGVRFLVHNGASGKLNYYTLYFGGQYTYAVGGDYSYLTYGLYKCSDGTVTTLKERGQSENKANSVNGYMGTGTAELTISIVDGLITWNLDYNDGDVSYSYNDSYQDANAFKPDGSDTTVHLYAGGGNSDRYVTFDNFSIASDVPYITSGEPENVIYTDAATGKEKNNGIIDIGYDVRIRKLLYDGDASDENVLVSKDGTTWYRLTKLSDFVNGKFLNNVTGDSFRYIYTGAASGKLTVLTDAKTLKSMYNADKIRLYPRMDGKDCFSENDSVLSTSNSQLIMIDGNYISPLGIGTADIGLTGKDDTYLTVTYTNGIYSYKDSFDNCGTERKTGANVQFDAAWRSKNVTEGKMGYNDAATFGYVNDRLFVQSRGMMDGNSSARYPRWAETVPAVVFNAEHGQLSGNQVIKTKITKESGTETAGVRFMVHDNGNSYYALLFPGMYALGGLTDKDNYRSSWELIKCDRGQYTLLDKLERKTETRDVEGGYLGWATGELSIEYVDGKISWRMPVYNGTDELYEWSSEFKDKTPYTLVGNNSTVWLMAGLYSGDNAARGVYYDDIEISSYMPYITTDEPAAVVYRNIIENKTDTDNIYQLDKPESIRRIVAENITEPMTVSVSPDGAKWYNMCTFKSNGEFLNNIYADKFAYIKAEGSGTISVLSEIEDNRVGLLPDESIKIYPYINSVFTEPDRIVENTGCVEVDGTVITGKSAIKNDVLTIVCGGSEQILYATVPLITVQCDVALEGANAEVSLFAKELAGVKSKVVMAFFNSDHSMNLMESYNALFENGTEKINVENFRQKGDYVKIFVWTDENSSIPYTKAVKFDIN